MKIRRVNLNKLSRSLENRSMLSTRNKVTVPKAQVLQFLHLRRVTLRHCSTTQAMKSLAQRPDGIAHFSTTPRSLNRPQSRLPASYYRGGTSRALIFKAEDLPADRSSWSPIFLGAIGSPDPNGRQLDGLGGGISSLSKVCVVGPSSHSEAHVDYTFAAIGVKNEDVDYSSNCGNMTAAIGPFAVDTGMIDVATLAHGEDKGDDVVTVRIHNTNTGKIIHSTFPIVAGEAASAGTFAIDGVSGTAAKIKLAFLNPAGSKTGKLLPTGNAADRIGGVLVTCIDAGNPCVIVPAAGLDVDGTILPDAVEAHPDLLARLEKLRCEAAVAMGICNDAAQTPGSIPKIVMASAPSTHVLLSGESLERSAIDLVVRAVSVGQPHRAVPITVAMAIAAAVNVEGSVVADLVAKERADADGITLGHSSGRIVVGSEWDGEEVLSSVTVFRTARRLMDGTVYWK